MRLLTAIMAIVTLAAASSAQAQTAGSVEDVQIRNIDLENEVVEIFNYGSSTISLSGWRFCTHDEIDGFDYSSASGLNGVSIAAGESLFIHWNDDDNAANELGISDIGGNWIDDLVIDGAGDGISIGLYRSGPFGNSSNLVDHVQYSFDGALVPPDDPRTGVAISAGLWTNTNDWISVDETSSSIVLTADPFPGAGAAHGAASYTVIPEPASVALVAGLALSGLAYRRRR